MEHKLALVCIHVLKDPIKLGIREKLEPIDETDSGLIYHCPKCIPTVSLDNWKTICIKCLEKAHQIAYA